MVCQEHCQKPGSSRKLSSVSCQLLSLLRLDAEQTPAVPPREPPEPSGLSSPASCSLVRWKHRADFHSAPLQVPLRLQGSRFCPQDSFEKVKHSWSIS